MVTVRTMARTVPRSVPSHRRRSALRLRDLRVRTKLLIVLTVPLLGFLAVTGVQVVSSVRTSGALADLARQVALGRQVNGLVHELQRERDRTVGVLAGLDAGTGAPVRNLADVAPDRTAVDRAAAALDAAVEPLRADRAFDRAYRTVTAGLAELPRIRAGAGDGWLSDQAVFDGYTRVIADLHALGPATVGGEAEVGRAVTALATVSRVKELSAQIRGLLYAACGAGGFGPGEVEATADVRAEQRAATRRFRADAAAEQVAVFDEVVSGQAVLNASRLEQSVMDNAAATELGVDAQQWWQASTTQLELLREAEARLLETAIGVAESRSAERAAATRWGTAASVALLLLALLTSLGIGRQMVRTLNSLREQALQVAQRRLPALIDTLRAGPNAPPAAAVDRVAVRSADEVGEVGEAFTAVYRSAVRLATEQAMLRHNANTIYVNLARRSQSLVERQLQLLDTLEAGETDPDQLANLFRLDHLATRMRRNDENLLVLAGGDAARTWIEPVPLTTVVLAAAAEIEHYTRVRHDITDDLYVAGHVVADLVHLLAELLENATTFSPPDTQVTVLGWAAEDRATLIIQDEGIGMSRPALAQANRQLAAPVSFDAATAERMGLVVVGHLARRHGIVTQLRSEGNGVAVLVVLPAPLLAAAPPAGTPTGPAFPRGLPAWTPPVAAPPEPADAPRRVTPLRAEDVLGSGQSDDGGVWWSRRPAAGAAARPTGGAGGGDPGSGVAPGGSVPAATRVGLPVRVPMAHLPGPDGQPTDGSRGASAVRAAEADPGEVGRTLARFYGGVHRAVDESDEDLEKVT
jgi:hypothetical protein